MKLFFYEISELRRKSFRVKHEDDLTLHQTSNETYIETLTTKFLLLKFQEVNLVYCSTVRRDFLKQIDFPLKCRQSQFLSSME